jgi:6-phosphogluconolactonase
MMNSPNLLAVMVLCFVSQTLQAADPLVFVSSFASGEKGAIHALRLSLATGQLTPVTKTGQVENPFFIAISPNQEYLYSIHATQFGSQAEEQVAAYVIDPKSGRLTFLNRQSTRGSASCFLEVDATGKTVLVANYTTGNVLSLPVKGDGSLGEAVSVYQHAGTSVDPQRQTGPHAHSFIVSPNNQYAYAADLGLDQILGYGLDANTARLTPLNPPSVKTPAGAGPRHLCFHPNGKWLYAINELANSVTRFDFDASSGTLSPGATSSTLPSNFDGKSYTADVKITPNGKFLYGTNRGHDSIAIFQIAADGALTRVAIEPSLGKGPQNLAITPDGRWLLCANMPGNNVAVFSIDDASGKLISVGTPIEISSPACIRLIP